MNLGEIMEMNMWRMQRIVEPVDLACMCVSSPKCVCICVAQCVHMYVT